MTGEKLLPKLISWNITLKCPLKCEHCYVNAGNSEIKGVISTAEAYHVIDQICEVSKPVLILSGGEPLSRPDIFDIARYGFSKGLRIGLGTSGYYLDIDTIQKLKESGVKAVAISLDSVNPVIHDSFRGVNGVFERAVSAISHCLDEGLYVQINMSVISPDIKEVMGVIQFGNEMGVRDFQIFFPVHTGRGREMGVESPEQYERIIRDILLSCENLDINVRPTCAPQFRRIAKESGINNSHWGRGCIAGIHYCRIYANGDVTPCPYIPVSAGNLRKTSFSEIWNNSKIFTALRDMDSLTGSCGICEYKKICGGCRARAYRGSDFFSSGWCDGLIPPDEVTADLCSSDPWCLYKPGVMK
ncbi:MAG: radical SAM protein [Methanomicrobiales archaeon]|nr:radical SAM protein [Methanomicrobiales archaeon]